MSIVLHAISFRFLEGDADDQLLFKRLTLKGSTLRSRDAEYQQNLLAKFEELALPLLKEKKMKIEVHEVSSCFTSRECGADD
jgi:hypothetical protein